MDESVSVGLPRTLEPELVASDVEALIYDDMDHSRVNDLFVEDLIAAGLTGTDVLDVGTGTARIPIALCRHHENVRVMAADFSVPMLDLARLNVEIAGLRERIQLEYSDAKQLPFADHMFDVVMSNSIAHHLAAPGLALREAYRVLRPGGRIFFRDLLRPRRASDVDLLVSTHAKDETAAAQDMFRASLHAALTLDEIRALVDEVSGRGGDVTVTSDRHWTWNAIRPLQADAAR